MRNFQNKPTTTTSTNASNTGTWRGGLTKTANSPNATTIPKPSSTATSTTTNNINQSWGPKTGAANISQVNNTQQQRAPVTNAPISFSKPTTPAPTTTTTTSTISNTSSANTASGSRPTNMFGPTGGYKPPVAAAGDETIRTKPIQKPKPDQNRASGIRPTAKAPEPKMPEPKPLSTVDPTKSIDQYTLNIDPKWKINYDDLEFSDLISTGSAGEVYLGYYFGTPVAIKKLFEIAQDQKNLVAREYMMLTEVNHPNIVQFLGICDHKSGIYLITEYIEHGDLFDLLIFGERPLDWKMKVKIALQIAQACFYLHSRGIIHRDLKSQNVLIGENMKVKLCDLGLATVLENKKRMTVCGTNEWMAPEIMMSDTYDSKVDIFSFGIVVTELVTNQPPRKREFSKMLAFDVQKFIESLPEKCPEEFAQLVIDCTKFKPDQRPTFKDIVMKLRKLHDSLESD